MTQETRTLETCPFDFGTFEGFNFRDQCAIEEPLTAEDVLNWDHDGKGEAEFWPSGDAAGIALVFKGQSSVSASELRQLAAVLESVGDESDDVYLRIYYAVSTQGESLESLDGDKLQDLPISIYWGKYLGELRKEAAYELFELYYPELYKAWESTPCDGLNFDPDDFLDSPAWSVEEVRFGDRVALIICPN